MNKVIPTITYEEIEPDRDTIGFGDHLWICSEDYKGFVVDETNDGDEDFYYITVHYLKDKEFTFKIKRNVDILHRLQGRLKKCRNDVFIPVEELVRNPMDTESFLLSQCSNVTVFTLSDNQMTKKDNVSGVSLIVNKKHIKLAENLSKQEATDMFINWTIKINNAKQRYKVKRNHLLEDNI